MKKYGAGLGSPPSLFVGFSSSIPKEQYYAQLCPTLKMFNSPLPSRARLSPPWPLPREPGAHSQHALLQVHPTSRLRDRLLHRHRLLLRPSRHPDALPGTQAPCPIQSRRLPSGSPSPSPSSPTSPPLSPSSISPTAPTTSGSSASTSATASWFVALLQHSCTPSSPSYGTRSRWRYGVVCRRSVSPTHSTTMISTFATNSNMCKDVFVLEESGKAMPRSGKEPITDSQKATPLPTSASSPLETIIVARR
ncbi:hypothetical protein BC936DRAFT_137931 [Jimgerdemannia flammicorona]|uniref:Uncharacterized protein n=1 Tax=Jimgerdemannia flammicorona TaxID=994334 RepID=A0A433CWD4_9FUNG|nr:hypothetical protein BC936DRAFT_137931 [Jimgerdemannia flammicorona]